MDKTTEIIQTLLHVQTKADGAQFAESLKAELLEGWGSEVEVYHSMKAIAHAVKCFIDDKDIKGMVAEAIKKGETPLNGAKVEVKEMGVEWKLIGSAFDHYKELIKPIEEDYKAKLKPYQDLLKDAETIGKSTKTVSEITCPETGEVLTILPAIKTSTTTPVITLNNK